MNMKKYFELGMLSLLDRKFIDDITVGELISEVGSCKGTFYKHYIDKYDLCCSCFKNHIYNNISNTAGSWENYVLQFLTAFEKEPRVVLHAFESSDCNSARKYFEKLLLDYLTREFVSNGGDIESMTNRMSLELCVSSVTELTLKWLKDGRRETKEMIVGLLRAVMPQSIYTQVYAIA